MKTLSPKCSFNMDAILTPPIFTRVLVEANPNYPQYMDDTIKSIEPNPELTFNYSPEKPTEAQVELVFKIDTNEFQFAPYNIDITCVCHVLNGPDMSIEKDRNEVATRAHEFLFPAIREMILAITARQPWGQFSIGISSLDTPKKMPTRRKAAV